MTINLAMSTAARMRGRPATPRPLAVRRPAGLWLELLAAVAWFG